VYTPHADIKKCILKESTYGSKKHVDAPFYIMMLSRAAERLRSSEASGRMITPMHIFFQHHQNTAEDCSKTPQQGATETCNI